MIDKDKLAELDKIFETLRSEKTPWESMWKEIVEYMGLSYGQWGDVNSKTVPGYKVKDTTAREASDILADGVEGYAFNRSTPWFSYKITGLKEGADKKKAESLVSKVEKIAYAWLSDSNFYDEATGFIRCGADLSTAAMFFDYDARKSIPVFTTMHNKDYCFICDRYGNVETLFRYVYLTKKEAENFFGEEALPNVIKDDKDQLKKWCFVHMEGPVTSWDIDIKGTGDYFSIYWYSEDKNKTLLEQRIPEPEFTIWRWKRQIYGGSWGVDSPGMACLPIIKFVNVLQEDIITLSELIAKGHWKKTKGLAVNFKAGSVTELESGQDFARMQYTGDLSWLQATIDHYRQVINSSYKTDLFLILTQNIERAKTATEVAGIETEKTNLMASFFSRLGKEFLSPILLWMFKAILIHGAQAQGLMIEEAELKALEDMELEVAFASPMFNAQQRAFELQPTLNFVQTAINLAQVNGEVLDRIDFDSLVDMLHSQFQAQSDILVDKLKADRLRDQRAQAQLAMTQQAMANEQRAQDRADYDSYSKAAQTGSALMPG